MHVGSMVTAALVLFTSALAQAAEPPADPLNSVMWAEMHRSLLGGGEVIFDERVHLLAPKEAEDSMNVPVMVDISQLADVKRLLVFTELNPIHRVLELEPMQSVSRIGFRIKVQQATPVRAAVQTTDGVWHVGGRVVDAAGGGCTAPSLGSANSDWASRIGEVSGRLWMRDDHTRLRVRVMHPMDTGLVAGIPAFHIEHLNVKDGEGRLLARLKLHEPVAENPLLTLDLPLLKSVSIEGRDNNGNPINAQILPRIQGG